MTGAELKTLREGLNLSAQELADILSIKAERSVRRWEDGSRAVPDDVADAVEAIDRGTDALARAWAESLGRKKRAVMLRYDDQATWERYQHAFDLPWKHAFRIHSAALGRLRRTAAAKGGTVRLVSMDAEAFEAWRFMGGLEDSLETRAQWAESQIEK